MTAVSKSLAVSAPAETILAIVLDVEAYPEWQKEVQKAVIEERDDQGRPARATMSVSAMGQEASYTVVYDYPNDKTVQYHLVEGDTMTKNDATFAVSDGQDGASELTVEMDLALTWNLPEFMITQVTLKGVKDMLRGIKKQAEQ